jgi:hypothetical protein
VKILQEIRQSAAFAMDEVLAKEEDFISRFVWI